MLASPLCADSWRIGCVSLNPETTPFHELVVNQAKIHLSHTSLQYPEWEFSEHERQRQWDEWESWAKAYANLSLPSWGQEESFSMEALVRDVALEEVPYDQNLASLAREGNLSWFCDQEGYDEILYDESTDLGGQRRRTLSCYVRASDKATELVDALSFQDDAGDLKGEVTLALRESNHEEREGALVLQNMAPSLKIEVDGSPSVRDGELLILPEGNHTLTLSSAGYVTRTIDVEITKGNVVGLDASLLRMRLPSLTLVSEQGEVSWFVDGLFRKSGSSLTLENPELPLLVMATKDGFLTQSHQLTKSEDLVAFRLSPDWMRNASVSTDVQKQFYGSFFSLIASVGLTLAYPTLYNVYGDGNYLAGGFYVACQGAVAMSAISLVRSLFNYSVTTMRQ